ncbi:RagB/SusD family nutrient uptake outer membrane protein [Pontibacter virosus]|uniref:SusD-like starch-binding protein associating with outer membrane n=1 Tax=Pontibacter virosus TaxID=1765052 RepID=A0A2U1AWX4_9BACT|nr:RagB/SusD family nutrient uptake outer membrane protein [Pontibacter virosus]PVY40892.1 SusD-like starch-binding protein associating with outer membrane [Pontibacter virosus]
MKNKNIYTWALCLLSLAALPACEKEFLELKPDRTLVVPSTLEDLQALLDHGAVMYQGTSHALAEIGSDDYFVSTATWRLLPRPEEKNGYIWAKEVDQGQPVNDWDYAYRRILYANTVLEGLQKLQPSPAQQEAWYQAKGMALFHRGWAFFQLAQLFAKPYDATTAAQDPGIPLRLSADVAAVPTRQSVADTYRQILEDLQAAEALLPERPIVPQRPGKAAARQVLARTYLQLGDYTQALAATAGALQLASALLDYNTLDKGAAFPFPAKGEGNPEIVFYSNQYALEILYAGRVQVDSVLYQSYDTLDLRRQAFFYYEGEKLTFKGSYEGDYNLSTALTTGELYLTKAECQARLGQPDEALHTLNQLLARRYKAGAFEPLTTANTPDALARILAERRKELLFRGLRWQDLRRLNKDPRFAKTLVRLIDGQRYELPPNDPRYVWPIPDNVVQASGLPQNPR